jgi:SAM-dependent methyltransferase
MEVIQADFDRIALVATDSWNRNNQYYHFLLRHIPSQCHESLEIGCGTGSFSRLMAQRSQQVLALDLSPEMIRIARASSQHCANIEFKVADVGSWEFPPCRFDCIVSVATLHHLPLEGMLARMKDSLRTNGALLVLDLFEPKGLWGVFLSCIALPAAVLLSLLRNRRWRASREQREAWAEHDLHDSYPTFSEVREIVARVLPGAKIKKHLLWRYSIVWEKS